MDIQNHEDHASHAQAAFDLAVDEEDQLRRIELLGIASFHAAMAGYTLNLENRGGSE
jgi:hypothetical protein